MKKNDANKDKKRVLGRILAKEVSREELEVVTGRAAEIASAVCAEQSNCTDAAS